MVVIIRLVIIDWHPNTGAGLLDRACTGGVGVVSSCVRHRLLRLMSSRCMHYIGKVGDIMSSLA